MKTKTKIIIVLAALCAGTLTLAACDENPHTEFAKQGYNISVRWDSNGGKLETQDDAHVVDDYKYDDVMTGNGIKLYAPNDTRRKGAMKNVERSGYFLAGWYREREPRTNEQGEPLDMYGNVCVETPVLDRYGDPVLDEWGDPKTEMLSAEGYPQSYMYSGRWDFEHDRLNKEELGDFEYEAGEYALTLYAGWVPMFTYEVYGQVHEYECEECGALYYVYPPEHCTNLLTVEVEPEEGEEGEEDEPTTTTKECGGALKDNGTGWHAVATKKYDPTLDSSSELAIPTWVRDKDSGSEPGCTLDYGNFPKPDKTIPVTFVSVHATEEDALEGTDPLDKIVNRGDLDLETGTATGGFTRYYARFDEGIWSRIYTEEDAMTVAGSALEHGCYNLMADLDFTEKSWPIAFSRGTFDGIFRGNGHTISNVTVVQNGSGREGLFGEIAAGARIEKVTFRDITFRLETASRSVGSQYGLFAGTLSESATLSEVTVTGTFVVGSEVYVPRGRYDSDTGTFLPASHVYDVGLLTGNFELGGLSPDGIELVVEEGRKATVKDRETGELEITE